MMKKIFNLMVTMLVLQQAYAQKAKVTSNLNFSGQISTYPIEMMLQLQQEGDSVIGSYYYVKNGRDQHINLMGTLKNGELKLIESTYDVKKRTFKNTGEFRLAYVGQTALSGTWRKDNATPAEKAFGVTLHSRERLKSFDPAAYVFEFGRNKAKLEFMAENANQYHRIVSLKVFINKSMRWAFTDFDDDALAKEAAVELEDVNFDGFLDIKVPIYFPYRSKGDFAYLHFVYDPVKKGFIKDKQLDELEFVWFDPVKREVIKVDADGNGNEGTSYYKWFNQKLSISREVRIYENDPYTHYKHYHTSNGKTKLVNAYKKKE